jgi:hypothetical protein
MSIDLPLSLSFFLSFIHPLSLLRPFQELQRKKKEREDNGQKIFIGDGKHTKKQKAKINNYFMIYKRQGEGSRR